MGLKNILHVTGVISIVPKPNSNETTKEHPKIHSQEKRTHR